MKFDDKMGILLFLLQCWFVYTYDEKERKREQDREEKIPSKTKRDCEEEHEPLRESKGPETTLYCILPSKGKIKLM